MGTESYASQMNKNKWKSTISYVKNERLAILLWTGQEGAAEMIWRSLFRSGLMEIASTAWLLMGSDMG